MNGHFDWLHLLLGLATLVLPLVAAWLRERGSRRIAELLEVVIKGVERSNAENVKKKIQETAEANELQPELDRVVQRITSKLGPPPTYDTNGDST